MPYILSPIISKKTEGLWGEGKPYESSVIYDIKNQTPSSPPIHYEAHHLKPHSLPHFDAPAHILENGQTVDWFYRENQLSGFYGKVLVVRLNGNNSPVWAVSKTELKTHVEKLGIKAPKRIIVTTDNPDTILVLSEEAAQWLIESNPEFCLYGTSWKSTDFQPDSKERPIHRLFFGNNVSIFECLNLENVPAGEYYWFAFPLPLEGASESPVCPVLFTKDEVNSL
jgi:kynurenine formamidase